VLSAEDRALIAAMELLRKQFADATSALLSSAANTRRSAVAFERQATSGRDFIEGNTGVINPGIHQETPSGKVPELASRKLRGEPEERASPEKPTSYQQQLKELNEDPARNSGRAKKALNETPAGAVLGVLGEVAGKFAQVAGPAALLGQALSSNLSGFQLFGQAVADFGSLRASLVNRGPGASAVECGLLGTLKSLQLSMGPRAQISQLGEVSKQIQMARLNQDPIEARMLKTQQEMLGALNQVVANTRHRRAAPNRVHDPTGHGPGSSSSTSEGADDWPPSAGGDYGEGNF
jgi:hypothetical protein